MLYSSGNNPVLQGADTGDGDGDTGDGDTGDGDSSGDGDGDGDVGNIEAVCEPASAYFDFVGAKVGVTTNFSNGTCSTLQGADPDDFFTVEFQGTAYKAYGGAGFEVVSSTVGMVTNGTGSWVADYLATNTAGEIHLTDTTGIQGDVIVSFEIQQFGMSASVIDTSVEFNVP